MSAATARPLRALAVLLALYVGGRLTVVYASMADDAAGPQLTAAASGRPGATFARALGYLGPTTSIAASGSTTTSDPEAATPRVVTPTPARIQRPAVARGALPAARSSSFELPAEVAATSAPAAPMETFAGMAQSPDPAIAPLPPRSPRRSLSGTAWLLVRDDASGASLVSGGTLGGSQLGARLFWHPVAGPGFVTLRGSAALATRDREIAPGIGIRGRRVGAIVEQRFSLERGRSSETAAIVYGGVGDVVAPLGFRLDGYGQAGIVGLTRRALFVDGAVRAERQVAGGEQVRLGAGAGLWGAAQPGASRLDIGPQLVMHLPRVASGARLSAEYRLRVTGNARPNNGPAITLGADF